MIDLSNVALFIADTRDYQLALNTIAHCCKYAKFGEIVFLTDLHNQPQNFKDNLQYNFDQSSFSLIPIRTITSQDDYSNLILSYLYPNVSSHLTYVLIIQTDGFIVNPDAWDPRFLEYDYIGAPWWYYPYNHQPPHPLSTPISCVGNGGFSLRSRKLLEKIDILLTKNSYPKMTPEDLFICRTLRPELQSMGIKFAPEWLAYKFSCEDRPYDNQFGFHGHQTYKLNEKILPKL